MPKPQKKNKIKKIVVTVLLSQNKYRFDREEVGTNWNSQQPGLYNINKEARKSLVPSVPQTPQGAVKLLSTAIVALAVKLDHR
ncbi:AAEL010528-PA [Aedes aegypti]|uniref:AAEL010528-PA n=1 Tax=Aedes aegypti TaxID=7159 RepID=Q16SQ4_AEDAE|nr:AAEL010528-PA [Aedes aegypti]